jgi:hypothetical protein
MRHYYVDRVHGALLILAPTAREAREIARLYMDEVEVEDCLQTLRPLPNVAIVDADDGFKWADAGPPPKTMSLRERNDATFSKTQLQMKMIIGYRFLVPLTLDEQAVIQNDLLLSSQSLQASFSPNGEHMFVLASPPVKTMPNGEIMGIEVDIVVPAIEKVRPEPKGKFATTEAGSGWNKMYDATHAPGCKCATCEEG